MSLGGSMLSTLKSNKSIMLDKSKRFRKTLGGYSNKRAQYDFPKATPKQLTGIRKKLKKENQLLWIKVIGLSSLIIIGLVLIFIVL